MGIGFSASSGQTRWGCRLAANRRNISKLLAILVLVTLAGASGTVYPQQNDMLKPSLRSSFGQSLDRGLAYLREHQEDNGSWQNHPGITGLATMAFLQRPAGLPSQDVGRVQKALDYLAGMAKPDGGIYDRDTPSYNTAIALQALETSGDPRYQPLIEKAQRFIIDLQADEGEGYTWDDQFYGGIGYGNDLRPDLTNLQNALEALKESDLPENHPVWAKAIRFVQRTQNYSETNDQPWAGNDGGFLYYPGFSYHDQGGTRSYGSATFAGLMIYHYAGVKKEDPRVRVALEWIRDHYTVDENPGMGLTTLYYYYLVFARALQMYGDDIIVDSRGQEHNWREDLGNKLVAEQHQEGFWVNTDPAFWQDNPVLVTAFASLAMEHLLELE